LTRLVLRTHLSASHPEHLVLLCCECMSQDAPGTDLSIQSRLFKVARPSLPIEKSAPTFYVEWAKALGLLTRNWSLTGKGKAIAWLGKSICSSESGDLPREVVALLLKYYLEADGALMLALAQQVVSGGYLDQAQFTRDDSVERMIVSILNDYLSAEDNIRSRVFIKQQIRTVEKTYKRETRPHKILPHLVPLCDFGLMSKEETPSGNRFVVTADQRARMLPFLAALRSIRDLELAIASNSLALLIGGLLSATDSISDTIGSVVAEAYEAVSEKTAGLAELTTLNDAVWAWFVGHGILVDPRYIADYIEKKVHSMPRLMRFHVDRQGEIALIVIDNEARRALTDEVRCC